ncbi:integrin alpha-IIb isoform X1 [Malaclemys terrapin pileata]|uniref:integrin alpha-IIb isoform X1 n=1 Tax=Malaclemys terrapin pileata TaxID=2991368 RepID=UPI0023A80F72|nr:integrin alpha-IIb isoform X1 [Malaclemys terrapin pileata]
MAGAQGLWLPLPPLWLWCWVQVLLAPPGPWPVRAFNLHSDRPTIYAGPNHSYFGFAMDFFQGSKGSMSVVVGAPRANTSQPGVVEAGAVYLCPWAPGGTPCSIIEFDPKGDQAQSMGFLQVKTYKSHQWFGASVSSWDGNVVACAPLQHWNAFDGEAQATQTPVGTCFVATDGLSRFAEYAPCRCHHMDAIYENRRNINDKRYCEVGFSATITHAGRLVLGAPGGYYFVGLIYSVNLSAVVSQVPSSALLWSVAPEQVTEDMYMDYDDAYRGYSVAVGEFDGDPATPEYVVGVPNKSMTLGVVEIFSARKSLVLVQSIQSEQVASYFGHTVAVADVNGDGKDDILVGAPLYMEHRSDRKLYEVGCIYLYLQHRGPHPYRHPWQTMTGTEVYGRFGTAIAPAGDLDQDGYVDVAVGAPFVGSGRVLIFRGYSEGLRTPASQVLESPFPGRAAFGFSVRGATDIDANGYPDVLVGAFGASKVAVYRAQPVVVASSQLLVPDVLNPEEKTCTAHRTLVSCFPIQLCVGIKGKSLPERIRLAADLQLDRLKPTSGRRVWELQTHQAGLRLELQLSREAPLTCQNLTAYLRDEADFKDKLSPIVVSLALSLAAGLGTEELGLVLYGQTVVQEQTRIVLDCGEDNVCIPKLQLAAHTPVAQLFIGAENVVHILADATNAGEGAFEAELRLQLPRDAHYQKATSNVQGLEKLICNLKKENETRVVICELGNPMKSGTKIAVDVALSISNLEDAGDTIEFQLQLWSKNSRSPHSNVERVQIPIKVAALLDLRGNSLPATMVLPVAGWELVEGSRRLEDHGPRVEHVYQLHNQGPGTVSQAELRVEFPNQFQGDFLLYMMELNTEGRINCSSPTGLNPLELEGQKPTASPGHNMSDQPAHRRERREADKAEAGPATLREPTLVNCSSQPCVAVLCKVEMLERDQRAMVTVHSVLWMQSVRKRPHDQFIIQSQAWFNVSAMPYRIQPELLPSGHATAHTEVVRVSPDAEKEIPTWWVVLAVLAGLLLLALFICALWKMGFFKRTRPPMDDQEELTSDETGEPCTGKGQ